MINLKELRIGSWVQCSSLPMRVVSIHDDETIYCDFEGNEGDVWGFDKNNPCKSIPLTEEILLRCGFYEDVSGFVQSFIISYWNNIRTVKTQFEIVLDDVNGPVGVFVSGNNVIHLRSLHQLQNLYFAIVGKELEINF